MRPESTLRPKFIASLTFRGFIARPQEVESIVGRQATLSVAKGESRNAKTRPFKKSAVGWALEFPESTRLDEMVPALIESLGGVENLARAKALIAPELVEVDISMGIIDSDEQEGGLIDPGTIAALGRLGASLSLGFYARREA